MACMLAMYNHIIMIISLIVAILSAKSVAQNNSDVRNHTISTPNPNFLNFTYLRETMLYTILPNQTVNATKLFNVTEHQNSTESTTEMDIEATTTTSSKIDLQKQFINSHYNDENPCLCDLSTTSCDVNCCCDKLCSKEDLHTFSDCGMPLNEQDSRYCFQKNFVFINNTPYRMMKTSKNLFCIYTDNFKDRLSYKDIPVITSASTFKQVVEKYQAFSWPEQITNNIEMELKVGAPIYVQYNDKSIGYLVHLRSLTSGECITNNPAAYMINVDDDCHQYIAELERDCAKNIWLNGRTYYQGFKIIRNSETIKNDKNISDAELVEIVPQLCLQVLGLELECNTINEQELPTPFYNEVLQSCNHVVTRIEYEMTFDSAQGIDTAIVRIALGQITKQSPLNRTRPIKWMQNHGIVFRWANENYTSKTPLRWSGNPGYQIGAKILAGKLISHDIGSEEEADVRLGVQLSQDDSNWLTILGASPFRNGHCISQMEGSAAGRGRISVTFGHTVKTGCLLVVSQQNLTYACTTLQTAAIDALLGWNPPDVVGAYGNSKVENPGEWVPILRQNLPSTSRSVGGFACTNIVREMHMRILHANSGSLANPQSKIVGVEIQFSVQNELKLRCIGRYCQTGAESMTQAFPIVTSVTFVDVSESAVQVYAELPTLHAELPNDFFYPFTTSSSYFQSDSTQNVAFCMASSFVLYILWSLQA